jgi:pantoate--beta-alanine ligase
MEIIHTPETMQEYALDVKRQGRSIGFVPTMGFLHEGHLSLMRMARENCDVLVVSIFINPAQFGPNEDLAAYPRDFKHDGALCDQEGVDVVFYPEPDNMYASDASVWVEEKSLSGVLCGVSRPGHFRGVCTVVAKLFNIVQPDLAVFGEKDAQQLRIIERMVRDLNFPVRIIRGPIVREPDGLAMSSRNKYLTGPQRTDALCLQQALGLAKKLVRNGERSADVIREAMYGLIGGIPGVSVDYIELMDDEKLAPVERLEGTALVALAANIGTIRLIDNAIIEV